MTSTDNVHALVPRQRAQSPIRPEHVDAMIALYPGGLRWRRTFPGTPDQIPHARYFARYLLADSPHRDDAELIVAELATNALQHSSSGGPHGTFVVEITRTIATITLAVYDCGWGPIPRFARRCRTNAERGRGLAIVAAIADQTGHEGNDTTGHKVWARIHTQTTLKGEDGG
ncbi:ATP-binding protein [Nonomuraea glycinis]|uniref:ATP-binding protein n=1 Tax=Nonomuraea glycinis TaxID=2047744 RepID=UPI00339F94E9